MCSIVHMSEVTAVCTGSCSREIWDVVMRCACHSLAPPCLSHIYIFRIMLCKQQIISAHLTIFEVDGNECKEHETMNNLDTLNFTFILDCFHFFLYVVCTMHCNIIIQY